MSLRYIDASSIVPMLSLSVNAKMDLSHFG